MNIPIKENIQTEHPDAYISISGMDRVYLNFYQFKETPFSITPDPDFLFLSHTHKSVIDKILYGISSRMGFILLTGEVGTGKTTICRAILDGLSNHAETVYIINPSLSGRELISSILDDLGVTYPAESSKKELIDHLNEFLLSAPENRPTVIIIDDAQTMTLEALEDLRLLSNLETDKQKLVQMVLVGQLELSSTISDPKIRQLKQRVAISCQLEYLTKDEIEGYISRRLFIAGDKGYVRFTRRAIRLIYKASNGIPRLINKICDYALTAGYIANHFKIDHIDVKKALAELDDWNQKEKETSTNFFDHVDLKSRKVILSFVSGFLIASMILLFRPLYNSLLFDNLEKTPVKIGRPIGAKIAENKTQVQESAHLKQEKTVDKKGAHISTPDVDKASSQISTPDVDIKKRSPDVLKPVENEMPVINTVSKSKQTAPKEDAVVPKPQPVHEKEISGSYKPEEITDMAGSKSYSFILQLGSFSTLNTTMKAVTFYTEKGIKVHWNSVDLGKKGIWYRIFTGVFKTKEDLIQYRNDLNLAESMIVWTPWTVLAGQSSYCEDLDSIQSVLGNRHYDFFIKKEHTRCQILSGAFVTREGAEKLAEEMLANGIPAKVVHR